MSQRTTMSFTDRSSVAVGTRWQWMVVISLTWTAFTYLAAVHTWEGQFLENSALLGSRQIEVSVVQQSLDHLDAISYTSLAITILFIAVIGLMRHSWRLAAAGVSIVTAGTILTEVLKRNLLPRPLLADNYPEGLNNSFPSGHTTIAMTIMVALLVVVPYRWRGITMFLAMGWALAISSATITAHWHRLSDTIGADMVALTFGALAMLWLRRHHMVEQSPNQVYPLRVVYVFLVGLSSLILAAISAYLLVATIMREGVPPSPTSLSVFNDNLFLAAQGLAHSFSALSGLVFWLSLRRLQTVA